MWENNNGYGGCYNFFVAFAEITDLVKNIFLRAGYKKKYTNFKDVEIKCKLDATDNFYCRSCCLLNMFRGPLCPSSGAREGYVSDLRAAAAAAADKADT